MDFVTSSCNPSVCLMLAADIPHTSFDTIDEALPTPHLLTAGDVVASSSVVLSPDSQYTFYTDGSLINLGTCDVSMGWGWVQIVKDSGFLNSIATYKRGIIRDWPSSSRAEAAAIYAALSASPANSVVHIYTDSQSSIEDPSHYEVDWALTWHTLMFQPKFDNSFTKENVSRHHTLKFQLFLEDLPTLESLKRT
ncbi:ribonuclease H-like domain-containing protein [Rhizophagus irregularis DAOM 181602=DAOM 197198]|nr:ribonuclease H-like domain-containing protein [Rhizophagus irregularis DAOM 181602=DAOM 197198]